MSHRFFYLFFAFFCCFQAQSQTDSLTVRFDVVFGADRLVPRSNSGSKSIYLPENIRAQRLLNNPFGLNLDEFTDAPQFHASVFAGLLTNFRVAKGYNLHLELFAEDRGQSFGSLDVDNYVVFPRIYGEVEDEFDLLQRTFKAKVQIGDLINYQYNEGLTVNNVDAQGIDMRVRTGSLWLSYVKIGDLSRHVGLNIGELTALSTGYFQETKDGELEIGVSNEVFSINPQRVRNQVSLFGHLSHGKHRYSWEIGSILSDDSPEGTFLTKKALLLGYDFKPDSTKKTVWQLKTRLRYFGRQFNNSLLEGSTRFRDTSQPVNRANTVGDFLYPLINSYRDFDQWSVYTEYQRSELVSLSTRLEVSQQIWNKLQVHLLVESNFIYADNVENALYVFYRGSLDYQLPGKIMFQLYLTNKVMNLDAHFQTFYQSSRPILGFSITRLGNYKY